MLKIFSKYLSLFLFGSLTFFVLSVSVSSSAKKTSQLQVGPSIPDNNNFPRTLENYWTYISGNQGLGGYTGTSFSAPVSIRNKDYRVGWLVSLKGSDFARLSSAGFGKPTEQLQKLFDNTITVKEFRDGIDAANNTKLDNLWTALKTVLTGYTGFNFANVDVDVGGNDYKLNLLITGVKDPTIAATDGRSLDGSIKAQLQALVSGGVTDANLVRIALDTADNNKKLDDLWTALKTALTGYTGFNFANVDVEVDGNNYKLNLLIDNKADRLSGSTLTTAKGQAQLQDLVNGGVTNANLVRTALDAANKEKFDNLWNTLNTELRRYGMVINVTIDNKQYSIGWLFPRRHRLAHVKEFSLACRRLGRISCDYAAEEIKDLLAGGVSARVVRAALDLQDSNKNRQRNSLWTAIQLHLNNYPNLAPDSIIFNGKTYNIDQLFHQKAVTDGSALSDNAKIQLQILSTAGMTTLDQMKDALTNANTALLTTLWGQIQDEFQAYPGAVFDTEITVLQASTSTSRGTFTINELLTEKDDDFADLSSDGATNAKTQLQALLNAKVANGEVGTALTLRNTNALNALWNAIQPLLSAYSNLAPDSITHSSQSNLGIDKLFEAKDHARDRGSTISDDSDPSAKDQLQALVNAGMTTGPQMTTALTNANTALLTTLWGQIQDEFQAYPGAVFDTEITVLQAGTTTSRGTFTINELLTEKDDDFADLSSDGATNAKSQLQALLNAKVANGEVGTALTLRNTNALNALWNAIQPLLSAYSNLAPDSITHSSQSNLGIDKLFEAKDHARDRGSTISDDSDPSAKDQLQALVNAGMSTGLQMTTALTNANTNALNALWNAIQPLLSAYSNLAPDSITHSSQSNLGIDKLFEAKDHARDSGSTISDDGDPSAKDQLQALVNAGMTTGSQMTTALTNANTALLTTLWGQIQDEFQAYPGAVFDTEITVLQAGTTTSRGTFTINELLTEKDDDFADLSSDGATNAKSQLQALLNAKVANGEVGTALTLRNTNALNALWNAIQPLLSAYSNLAPDSITHSSQSNLGIDKLFEAKDHARDSGSTISDDSDPSAKDQLQALVNAGMSTGLQMTTALTNANTNALNALWNAIQPLLSAYSNLAPDSITHSSQSNLGIDKLFEAKDHARDSGSTISDDGDPSAKDQLQALVNAGMTTGSQMTTALTNANTALLTTLWGQIQDEFQAYPGAVFDTEITVLQAGTTTSRGTFTINELLTEKDDDFADLSSDGATNAKSQLQALLNAKVANGEVGTALTLRNTNALNALWNAIQPLLSAYSNLAPDSITHSSQSNLGIDKLFEAKDHARDSGSTISDDGDPSAKDQLQALVNAGMTTGSQMTTALTNANTALLTTLWGQIQDEFQAYPGAVFDTEITVLQAGTTTSRGTFTINELLTEKDDDFADLSSDGATNAKSQLQALLNAKVANGEVGTALTLRNTNALNALWNAIQPLLSAYSNLAPDSITHSSQSNLGIDKLFEAKDHARDRGSTISDDGDPSAKDQLQALVNAGMTTGSQMTTALTNANTTLLTTLWGQIQDEFQAYPGAVFDTEITVLQAGTTTSRGTFTINELLTEKDDDFADLSSDGATNAKSQLQALLNAKVANGEVGTALTLRNTNALNALWNAIQPLLSAYSNLAPDSITHSSQSNLGIDKLFEAKDHARDSGSTISDDGDPSAKDQLQALVNAGMSTGSQMTTALTNANTALLTTLWGQIQDEFQAYPGAVFDTEITVLQAGTTTSRGTFTINELLTEKDDDFADLSSDGATNAKSQLQALLNAKVANGEVGTALTLRNTNALNALWNAIQPLLSAYSNLAPDSITHSSQSNLGIDKLFEAKDHARDRGSTISDDGDPSAKDQLQALVNAGMTTGSQMTTALTNANTTLLTTLWGQIQDEFQAYPGAVFDTEITVLQAGTTTSRGTFTINELLTEKDDDFADLSSDGATNAKSQLQALLNAKVANGEVGTALTLRNTNALNALWNAIQPLLSAYSNLAPDSITHSSQSNLGIDKLFEAKDHARDRGSTISDDGDPSAKDQLQALINAGMSTGLQMTTALTNANTALLTTLWGQIQDEFQAYPGAVFDTEITVLQAGTTTSRGTFTINELLTEKDDDFADLSSDGATNAKSQLQALLNAKVANGEVGTALTLRNTNALNALWNAIQPLLSAYSNLAPDSITHSSQSNLGIDKLFEAKDHARDSGSTISDDGDPSAKDQLQALVNAGMTTGSQMTTALTNANTALLTTLWGQIQDEFQAYPGAVFDTEITVLQAGTTTSRGTFTINELLTEKDDDFADLSSDGATNAKSQLQALLNAKVANGEVGTALTLRNTNALNALWNAIQPLLSAYSNLAPDSITHSSQSNLGIDKLFEAKDHARDSGSTISDDGDPSAKDQLQALVNAGMTTGSQMTTALTNANTTLLTTLWGQIQDEFQAYPGAVFDTEITVLQAGTTTSRGTFTINELLTEKDDDFADLSSDGATNAKSQLQALLNAKVANGEVGTALTLRNTNALNALWSELQPKLEKYADLSSYQITIGSGDNAKVYSLDQLFQDREETTGSNLPNGKSQLQTLVNDGVSVQQITTQLDSLVTKAEKEEADEAESKNKQNLAIGLGAAGGVVILAGAGGFVYWFVKIRKS